MLVACHLGSFFCLLLKNSGLLCVLNEVFLLIPVLIYLIVSSFECSNSPERSGKSTIHMKQVSNRIFSYFSLLINVFWFLKIICNCIYSFWLPLQVWNWFQNRRYALRSKLVKSPGNSYMPPNPQSGVAQVRSVPPVPQQTPVSSGRISLISKHSIPIISWLWRHVACLDLLLHCRVCKTCCNFIIKYPIIMFLVPFWYIHSSTLSILLSW